MVSDRSCKLCLCSLLGDEDEQHHMAKEHPHIKGGQGHTDTDLSLQGGAIVGLLMAIGLLIILAALITLAIYAPIPFMLTLFALIIMIPRHRPH